MAVVLAGAWLHPNSTESAVANGDTRTISFSNQHTNEEASFTYMVNGVYDQATLDKLNWFMRDWRLNEPTKMDPKLFDIIWEVYRESGSQQPIDVLSAYRSPETNAMLRRRSRQVAEHSQHMQGRAIDAHFLDVSTARIRDIAMRMQEGGVGFYPVGATPWVHIDCGSIRYWPRMNREALTRLFPDGKTVFIPSDGQPMPGYDQAKAEIEQRGGEVQTASNGGGLFGWLFGWRGGGADDAEEGAGQEATTSVASRSGQSGGRGGRVIAAAEPDEVAEAGPAVVAKAKKSLPTGPAYAGPAPAETEQASAPETGAKPQVVAALEEPKVETDAESESPVKLTGPIAALYLAPMPPKRPPNLEQQLALLADIPLPPIRPADFSTPAEAPALSPLPPVRPPHLALLSPNASAAPDAVASIAAPPTHSAERAAAESAFAPGDVKQLPSVITQGVTEPPKTTTLALAETPPSPAADDGALLARAAELTAPLPPMPIPNVAPPVVQATVASAPAAARHARLTDKLGELFDSLSASVFAGSAAAEKTRDGSRGPQP